MNEEQARFGKKIRRRPMFAFLGPLVIFLAGAIVMMLWNAILPELLSVKRISYWQSIGLFLLCRILFGGFGFRGRTGHFEGGNNNWNSWRNKWHTMSDEEKINFKEEWRRRCEERKRGKEQ